MGVAGDVLPGARHHGQMGEAFLMFVMGPEQRQHHVGESRVGDDDGQRVQQKALQPGTILPLPRFEFVVGIGHQMEFSQQLFREV